MPEAMQFASTDPREMEDVLGVNDFNGKIVWARLIPWEYPNSPDIPVQLAVVVRIKIFPDQGIDREFHDEIYTAGDLRHFKPGIPGVDDEGSPCAFLVEGDLSRGWEGMHTEERSTVEGTLPVRVGQIAALTKSCKWCEFGTSLLDSGFPAEHVGPAVTWIEGAVGHFLRVEQMAGKEIRDTEASKDGERAAKKFILVMDEFDKYEPGEGTAATPKAKKATDIEVKFVDVVGAALGSGPLTKQLLPALLMSKLEGKERGAAVKLITNSFLGRSDHPWTFDPTTGTVTAAE
jgi:hypothetical protein